MRRYSKTKREKVGICNLCRNTRPLSWDHVPPKGGIDITRMEMASLLDLMGSEEDPPVEESQNGVKYRTICKLCNELMGVEYDPHLNGLAKEIGIYLKSSLELPKEITLQISIQRVLKAIIGHMVAAKVSVENTKFDRLARAYVLNKHATLPDEIKLHYWIYPYDISTTIRDAGIAVIKTDSELDINFVQIMKYFPIAYVAGEQAKFRNLPSLSKYGLKGIDDVVTLKFDIHRKEKPFWPEEPSDIENSVLIVGQSGADAVYGRQRIPPVRPQ